MHICTILPHVKPYGGVRRYLEFGNWLIKKGHKNTLFVLDYDALANFEWIKELDFQGIIEPISHLTFKEYDVCVCGDASSLHYLDEVKAKLKVVNVISPPWTNLPMANYGEYLDRKDLLVVGNSTGWNGNLSFQSHWFTIPGAVNTEMFKPVFGRKSEGFNVLFMAKHRPWKNLNTILKAYEILKKTTNYKWGWFDTENHPELPKEMHGNLNIRQKDLAKLFSSYHCYISVETIAGWQNTAIEAMACGTPVICTAIGTKDFAHHMKTAYVLDDVLNAEKLADYIQTLSVNPSLRSAYSSNGLEIVKELTWEKYTDKWIVLLQNKLKLGEHNIPEVNIPEVNIPEVNMTNIENNAKKLKDNIPKNINPLKIDNKVTHSAIKSKAQKLRDYLGDADTTKMETRKIDKGTEISTKTSYDKEILQVLENTKRVHISSNIISVNYGHLFAAIKSMGFKIDVLEDTKIDDTKRDLILFAYKVEDIESGHLLDTIKQSKNSFTSIIIGVEKNLVQDIHKFISRYDDIKRDFLFTCITGTKGYFLIMENRRTALTKYLSNFGLYSTMVVKTLEDKKQQAICKISDVGLNAIVNQLMGLINTGVGMKSL